MKPIPQGKLGNLKEIFKMMIGDGNLQERSNVEYALDRVKQGYDNRLIDAYADDPDKPKHVLILSRCPAIWFHENQVIVLLIFSIPSERGTLDSIKAYREQIAKYAEYHNSDTVIASSWHYKGARGIDQFWRSEGYERQEVVYVKHLKNGPQQ